VRQRRNLLFFTACAAVFLLVCFRVQGIAQSSTWGEVRVAEHPVTVRHKPEPNAPVVRTLKTGDRVRVDFVQPSGWGALFDVTEPDRDISRAMGYAEVRQLTPLVQAKTTPALASPAAAAKNATDRNAAIPRPEGKSSQAPEIKSEVKQTPSLLSGQAPGAGKQDPVRITSDKMVYSQAENAVVFQGNVHGTQTDMAIWANKVTAYFAEKGKEQKEQKEQGGKAPGDFGDKIERIVAEGSVRLVAGKNEGACNQLTYFVADGILRMEGNPILREGQNTVRGDIIKFYLRENRSEVLSGTQRRVEAIFYSPKGDKK